MRERGRGRAWGGTWEGRKKSAARKDFGLQNGGMGGVRSGRKHEANMLGQGAGGEFGQTRCGRARGGGRLTGGGVGVTPTQGACTCDGGGPSGPTAARHGESNPEPCRPLGRQGGPASGCISCVHSAKPAAWTLKGRLIFSCNLQPARAAGRLSTQVGAKQTP